MLLKWAGGKSWLTKNYSYIFHSKESLKNSLKGNKSIQFNNYIEPFLGSGAVFKYLKPKNGSILSDINSELICFYNCLKLDPEKLHFITTMHMQKHSEDYYYKIRANHSLDDNIERAARFLYLNRTCYNGIYRVNSKGEFNVPIGDSKRFNASIEEFKTYSEILNNASIVQQDFKKTINDARKDDLIYVDPPYVTKSNEKTFDMYSANQFNWKDQEELAKILEIKNKEGVHIIVSNINDKDVTNLYLKTNGWNHLALNRANVMSYNAADGKKYKEILFKNF
tara:strand:- start:45 stop:887 length:843 start_codon:yes stop_codon:yes gene_type:complete